MLRHEMKGTAVREPQSEIPYEDPAIADVGGSGRVSYGIATILITVMLVLLIQWKTGAWRDDFSATGDEPAHFTSVVAMSSYLTSSRILHPYDFATQYYLHYPKVSFGKWPPFFHLISGVWFLLFHPSRLTAMLFMVFESALLGW